MSLNFKTALEEQKNSDFTVQQILDEEVPSTFQNAKTVFKNKKLKLEFIAKARASTPENDVIAHAYYNVFEDNPGMLVMSADMTKIVRLNVPSFTENTFDEALAAVAEEPGALANYNLLREALLLMNGGKNAALQDFLAQPFTSMEIAGKSLAYWIGGKGRSGGGVRGILAQVKDVVGEKDWSEQAVPQLGLLFMSMIGKLPKDRRRSKWSRFWKTVLTIVVIILVVAIFAVVVFAALPLITAGLTAALGYIATAAAWVASTAVTVATIAAPAVVTTLVTQGTKTIADIFTGPKPQVAPAQGGASSALPILLIAGVGAALTLS